MHKKLPIRINHLLHNSGRKAAMQLANQIMGRLIVASQYLAFRKPDGDCIQRPSFQLGKEERV
jgi:hypothetical protein